MHRLALQSIVLSIGVESEQRIGMQYYVARDSTPRATITNWPLKLRYSAKGQDITNLTSSCAALTLWWVGTSLEAVARCGASLLSDSFEPVPSPSELGLLYPSPRVEPIVQISRNGLPRMLLPIGHGQTVGCSDRFGGSGSLNHSRVVR